MSRGRAYLGAAVFGRPEFPPRKPVARYERARPPCPEYSDSRTANNYQKAAAAQRTRPRPPLLNTREKTKAPERKLSPSALFAPVEFYSTSRVSLNAPPSFRTHIACLTGELSSARWAISRGISPTACLLSTFSAPRHFGPPPPAHLRLQIHPGGEVYRVRAW